jgi:hypothetical protein
MRCRRVLTALLGTVCLAAVALPAQEPPIEVDAEGVENYPYTHDIGFAGYDAGEQQVVNIKLPVSRLFRDPEEHPWGLRLRFPISFGVYGLTFDNILEDLDFDTDRIKTVTFVPAAEFLIPLSERWLLKPRQDLGVGKDFEGGDWVLILATEVKGLYTKPWKNLVFTFGSGVKYSFSDSSRGLYDDDFARLEVGFDTLIPFGLDVGKHRVDFSLYIIGRHYFRALVFDQVLEDPLVIEQEGEVGITFGSTPRPRFWKFNIPRLLIGYRFAENFRGLRIKLGLPF